MYHRECTVNVPRIVKVVAVFQSHKFAFFIHDCGKLDLRGGYFCIEVVSTNHHHRPMWTHLGSKCLSIINLSGAT